MRKAKITDYKSVRQLLADQAGTYGSKPYMIAIDQDEKTLSYSDLWRLGNKMAHFFRERGLKANDRILMLSENTIEFVAIFIGVQRCGGNIATANVEMNRTHIVEILNAVDPTLVLFQEGLGLEELRNHESETEWMTLGKWCANDGSTGFFGTLEPYPDTDNVEEVCGPDDIAVIFYTSGTEAKPKGVMQAHSAVWPNYDALVNCAGISISIIRPGFRSDKVMFWDVPDEKWQIMFDINVTAPFMLTKAAVPHMIAQNWGRIVNVTTSLDTMIRPSWTPYGPSKAALEAASANWAGDLKDKGVTVNVLIPGGPANTNFVPGISDKEREKLVQPNVMAEPIKWLLSTASDGVTARRFLASNWEGGLGPNDAAEKASAPIAWQSLGRQAATEPVPI